MVAVGQSGPVGFSGSASDLTTAANGFWPIVRGVFPILDFDGDLLAGLLDPDDDNDGLADVVETGTGIFNGVYDVVLGETTPVTPGIVAGGAMFLEIVVEGETLTPRQRLLAVPYAVEAASASSVGGFSDAYVREMFEHFNFDGGPPNDDPSKASPIPTAIASRTSSIPTMTTTAFRTSKRSPRAVISIS